MHDLEPPHNPNDPEPLEQDHTQILLERMRQGDREAVGEFITLYGERIRRRVRGRLGPAMRRVVDSQEILSTVARRLDEIVNAHGLRADEQAQLWSLVYRIATNAIVDKSRVLERLRRAEGPDRIFAGALLTQLEQTDDAADDAGDLQLERLIQSLPDPVDRQILQMWLRDMPHVAIAQALDMPPGTVRRRWGTIKAALEPQIRRGLA